MAGSAESDVGEFSAAAVVDGVGGVDGGALGAVNGDGVAVGELVGSDVLAGQLVAAAVVEVDVQAAGVGVDTAGSGFRFRR